MFVTHQVISWKLACQMEEVPGHGSCNSADDPTFQMPIAAEPELAGEGLADRADSECARWVQDSWLEEAAI